VLVEMADRAGNEKLIAMKTKNQEGRPCVTICLQKKPGGLPLLDVAGGDKEVAGKVRGNGRQYRGNRTYGDRRPRDPCAESVNTGSCPLSFRTCREGK
jgi:hypothetical protein